MNAALLTSVVAWLHNSKANAYTSDFWANAADRIAGDLFNVDTTLTGWDDASALEFPSLWFYALLREARIWAEDSDGAGVAEASYQAALAIANSRQRQGAPEQLARPYTDD
jgi:hypothetical protein